MRFRPRLGYEIWRQVFTLCGSIFIAITSVTEHHRLTLSAAIAFLWIILLIPQIGVTAFISWSLGPDGIHRKTPWSSQLISYAGIVAIRPHAGIRKPSPTQIDIEYGELGSALNPRVTTIVDPKERAAFLDHLRAHTPQAVFDL